MALQLHTVAPRQGLAWVQLAFRTFFRRPMAFTSLFLVFLLVMLLALVLPYLGPLVLMASLPLLSLGYMISTRSALANGLVHPGQLVEPLRRGDPARRRNLLGLCLLYALATMLIVWLSDVVDGGRFEQLQVLMAQGSAASEAELTALIADPRLFYGMVVRLGLASLLAVPFWHAPALVWWGGQGIAQSLFSSTLACWRTKGAFAVYTLAWMAVVSVFSALAGGLFTLLGAGQLAGAAMMPAGLMFTVVFYVSLYFSFTDTFGEPPAT